MGESAPEVRKASLTPRAWIVITAFFCALIVCDVLLLDEVWVRVVMFSLLPAAMFCCGLGWERARVQQKERIERDHQEAYKAGLSKAQKDYGFPPPLSAKAVQED